MRRQTAERLHNADTSEVYSSPYQPEFCNWAFPYARGQDRFNPPEQCTPGSVPIAENPVPNFPAIDVMMTHGPPMGFLDRTRTDETVGCAHLLRAARRCRPRLHCFGHIHEGWGAQRVRWREGNELGGNMQDLVESTQTIILDHEKIAEEKAASFDCSKEGLEFGKETLMVNASIMTFTYKPWNAPWLVDLDLEKTK